MFIDLSDKPEWYLKIFPAGKVPALIYDDNFLSESLLLADFLDKQYPEPPLQTSSPLQTILDKLVIDTFGKVSACSLTNNCVRNIKTNIQCPVRIYPLAEEEDSPSR